MGKHKRSSVLIRISDIAPWRCAYPPAALRYAAMLRAGRKLPPIVVAHLGSNHYEILDGMHRARAAKLAGHKAIEAFVKIYFVPLRTSARQAAVSRRSALRG